MQIESIFMARSKTNRTHQESLAERILRFRQETGYTQQELAEKLGLTQSLVSAYERGSRRLYVDLLIQMADAFEVTPNELIGVNPTGRQTKGLSVHLVKRLQKIQELPKHRQKMLLGTIDFFLRGAGVPVDEPEE